ncbi:MAG: hypothetical protein JRG97_11440 [Deltaproteobacteria bacterium]|nr:hypothetical protein [Deltaproteobacteria bacterium]MBW2053037.1 hypothetical protein [Deltaproteobacteria bacterium]MBW2141666.1 hypothetical protein [Deltaproteobacteria bacterium]MBW2323184.1 hypothetical protein [Deltaproteobacteria bacterium]
MAEKKNKQDKPKNEFQELLDIFAQLEVAENNHDLPEGELNSLRERFKVLLDSMR